MAKMLDRNTFRTIREERGLTREELGRVASVSTSTVARIELGGHVPSGVALIALADALGVPVDKLLAVSPEVVSA